MKYELNFLIFFSMCVCVCVCVDQDRVSCRNPGAGRGSSRDSRTWPSTPHPSTSRAAAWSETATTSSSTTGKRPSSGRCRRYNPTALPPPPTAMRVAVRGFWELSKHCHVLLFTFAFRHSLKLKLKLKLKSFLTAMRSAAPRPPSG